jgi:hypothetical protein
MARRPPSSVHSNGIIGGHSYSQTTLARLLADSGLRDQARHVLTLVYDRFTEEFETADLRIARQVLEDPA